MLPQPLRRDPRTRYPKRDSSEEPRVVPDVRGSQYGLDLLLVDASFPRKIVTPLEELDRSIGKTKVATTATIRWYGVLVAEMFRQFTTRAARVRDQVNDLPDAHHVAFLPRFNMRVDGSDKLIFGLFALRERPQDTEAVHDTAGLEFNGTNVVPFLQFPDRVCA